MSTQNGKKVYRRGETILKEGDKAGMVYLISQGGVSQCVVKGKKNFEVFHLGVNQVIGEYAVAGQPIHLTSAISAGDAHLIEIPAESLKSQIELTSPMVKLFVRAVLDKLKIATNELKALKVSSDACPCPPDMVAHVFGAIYFAAKQKAEIQEDKTHSVDWTLFKAYCRRVFTEPPQRIEQAINLLVKVKLAKHIMGKLPEAPEGPDEILKVQFLDIESVGNFFELFQYYFFRPGNHAILIPDEISNRILDVFVSEAMNVKPDKYGKMMLDFKVVADSYKEKTGQVLNPSNIQGLETKGVFIKLRNIENHGVKAEFDLSEVKQVSFLWKIILEIDKWNQVGFVDPNEIEAPKNTKPNSISCTNCQAPLVAEAMFCHLCGAKTKTEGMKIA
ncbi:MAG: cyclic nucleotide-binding domain-containing protein [Pseudobdellovibrionaceae bacterium]